MIDFSTLKGLTIPEGVVTQITDESGRVIWAVQSGEPIVLEVEKITSNTYAGGTTYTGEQFILLDIYPKTNGTVKVTYGGLTKTIKDTSGAESPNAQKVFFGTFNGVTDEVATPASGELTIEGGCRGFGCGSYQTGKATLATDNPCITAITQWDGITLIPNKAFYRCNKLIINKIPEGVTDIYSQAFSGGFDPDKAPSFNGTVTLPSTLQSFSLSAFMYESAVTGSTSDFIVSVYTIALLSPTPPSLDYTMTDGLETKAIQYLGEFIVPKGCGEAYKTAEGWSTYADKIVEAS